MEQTRLRLESLIEIHQRLMSTMDPDAVLQEILESAIRLFAVEGCSIALIDETAQQLAFVMMAGPAKVEEFRIPLDQGIAGWVAQTGQGVVSNDVSQDPRFFVGVDQQTGFTTRSILCAPLRHRDQSLGVIEAINTTSPGGFTPEDLQLLTAFGGMAGAAITHTRRFTTLRNASAAFQEVVQDRYRLIIGTSPAIQEALRLARIVAAADSTVLLLGESGTGKEVLARAIHQWSRRAEHPFGAINCVALTPELLASELFGHEKGAFTGAIAQKKGKFELAEGGTLFLDEIGELAPDLQAKLLRVLQEKEFQRVGGMKDIRANVRILAATNRDLRQAMRSGAFREDLYYRLNVVAITLPTLRDRPEDVPGLVYHFLERYGREMGRPRMEVDSSAMEVLRAYRWPGNVRELQNVIERAVVLSAGPQITAADLPAEIRPPAPGARGFPAHPQGIEETLSLAEAIELFKCARIRQALERAGGNQEQAARLLGLARPNLSRLMKSLGLR
ncbi:MAG: sigma 54-interacting transcriptional regulator [Candidatus Tectomicrobia bacterium]|uniref:Sigma 54-interacting transcriptional regulator n=1 Tax=Tectimicrobiota bacterium TaxID=2528274 RepID=A0A932CLM8_UNCTE|nr:sigma 54-interacting transcriptional regulator [Candidatus Tectomicrobia bacterium]